ncbi:MAG: site-specific recombinase XerD, partial [Natrialbaceae archaeon]
MSLEPIDPETALELYLADKENDLAAASLKAHEYRLNHFVGWCSDNGIENLNTLTGRQLHRYRIWRREDGNLSPASEKTQMDTLRVFIRWLESVDGVEQDLSEKVLSPFTAGRMSSNVHQAGDPVEYVQVDVQYDAVLGQKNTTDLD